MNRKISIIVPVYNAQQTLCRCADALMAQTYPDLEMILIDDGSTDESGMICDAYAARDVRFRVIHKENGGVSSARNAGLDQASGDYVMFCDSDDWAEPDWCEELMLHHKPGSLVMCGLYVEGEQPFLPYKNCAADGNEHYRRDEFYRLKLKFITALWNKLYERDVIEKYLLRFDPALTNGEDYLFNIRYLARISGEILYLSTCSFHYTWPDEKHLSGCVGDRCFEECAIMLEAAKRELPLFKTDISECISSMRQESFDKYQMGMAAVLRDKHLTISKKIKKLNQVMESPVYQKCVRAKTFSNRLVRFFYSQKKSYGIMLLSIFGKI